MRSYLRWWIRGAVRWPQGAQARKGHEARRLFEGDSRAQPQAMQSETGHGRDYAVLAQSSAWHRVACEDARCDVALTSARRVAREHQEHVGLSGQRNPNGIRPAFDSRIRRLSNLVTLPVQLTAHRDVCCAARIDSSNSLSYKTCYLPRLPHFYPPLAPAPRSPCSGP